MLKGALDLCILALLRDGPLYGYAIVDALAGSGIDLIAEGTIYPLLTRMEKSGALSSYKAPSPEGPSRKYYQLTEQGERELASGHAQWRYVSDQVSRLLDSSGQAAEKGVRNDAH